MKKRIQQSVLPRRQHQEVTFQRDFFPIRQKQVCLLICLFIPLRNTKAEEGLHGDQEGDYIGQTCSMEFKVEHTSLKRQNSSEHVDIALEFWMSKGSGLVQEMKEIMEGMMKASCIYS